MNALVVHLRPAAVAGSDAGATSRVLHAHHSHNQRQVKIKMSGVAQMLTKLITLHRAQNTSWHMCKTERQADKSIAMTALYIFQTGVTFIRQQKRFMKTSHHCKQSDTWLSTFTRILQATTLLPLSRAQKHSTHTHKDTPHTHTHIT